MYEAHFGLKSRPFGSKAAGTGIFVGPQQMKVMTSLHKALAAQDAVVTVTGPVGVGKTTIVSRALESISPGRTAAWVGRMQLSPEEVLELLLAGFGIQGKSKGTIQKFTAFRRLLGNQAAAGARVAIIVEDAQKISPGALAELEAMTAADNGDTASANIILMGQPGLNQLLSTPELARMKQRNRLRQSIDPFSLAEVTGYLKHSIREAGGQYDAIFDQGVAELVHACSEGIPRVINTMCATALETAAEEGSARVTAALMHQVAVDAFGYDGPIPAAQPAVVEAKAAAEPAPVETKPEITPVASETKTEPKPVAGSRPEAKSAQACESGLDREPPAAAETEVPAEVETTAGQIEAPPRLPENATAEERAEDDLPPTARNLVVESGRYPVLPESAVESAEPAVESASVDSINDDEPELEIPELINDTQPELNRLEVPEEPGEPAPVVADAPIEKTGSTEVMEKLPEALAAKAEKPESAIDESRSDSMPGDDEEADFDLDAALSIDAGETNVMPGITPNLDTLAAQPRAQQPDPDPEPKPIVKTKAESRPEPAPGFTIAQIEAENELPSLDDLPTLSDSMRVDVDKEVGRAQELEAKNTPAPEAPAAPVAKTSPATEAPAAPVAKTRPATAAPAAPVAKTRPATEAPAAPVAKTASEPIAQVSELTARIAALDPSSRDGELDALEAALNAAKKSDFAAMTSAGIAPADNDSAEQDLPDLIPEITLDKVLPDQPDNDEELQKLAADIGNASSLEDMSDMMAETLFGSQAFEKIAAAVVANPPADHELADAPPEGPSPVKLELELEAELDPSPAPGAANDAVEPDEGEVALKESVALRIDMLNVMKGKVADRPAEQVVLGGNGPRNTPAPKSSGPQPEPIENQINTSITQTLEALDITKVADKLGDNDTKEKQKKSGGLFSRFRKSS